MTSIKSWPDPNFFFNLIAIWKLITSPRPHNLLGSKLRLDSWFPDRQFSALSIVPNPQSLFEIKVNIPPSGEKLKEDLLCKSRLFWELKALTDLSFQRIIHNHKVLSKNLEGRDRKTVFNFLTDLKLRFFKKCMLYIWMLLGSY